MKSLRPYQANAVRVLVKHHGGALFFEMRLGKTLIVLRWAQACCLQRVLIVAPNSAIPSWIDEIEEDRAGSYADLRGTPKSRLAALHSEARFSIINREGWRALPELTLVKWDGIVLDESQFIKNPRAGVSKFYLGKWALSVTHRIVMTGTPRTESDLDFVTQMIFANGSFCGMSSYWQVRSAMFRTDFRGYKWTLKSGCVKRFKQEIHDRSLVLRRQDIYGKQVVSTMRRDLHLPPVAQRMYTDLEANWSLGGELVKWSAAQYVHLRRIASGIDPTTGCVISTHKIDELLSLLHGDLATCKVVIWYVFTASLLEASASMHRARIDNRVIMGKTPQHERDAIRVEFWTNPRLRVLNLQVVTGETGMRLSCADTAIYYEEPLSSLSQRQSKDRIVDVEKKNPLLYLSLITRGTVEEDIHYLLKQKQWVSAQALREALKLRVVERRRK